MICNGREIIRAGYAAGIKVTEIARQCGSTPGSVKVTAHNMGLRHRRNIDVRVPEHQRADWRSMVWSQRIGSRQAAVYLKLEAAAP